MSELKLGGAVDAISTRRTRAAPSTGLRLNSYQMRVCEYAGDQLRAVADA